MWGIYLITTLSWCTFYSFQRAFNQLNSSTSGRPCSHWSYGEATSVEGGNGQSEDVWATKGYRIIGIGRFQWYFTTFLELEQHQLRLLALAFSGDQVTWVQEIKWLGYTNTLSYAYAYIKQIIYNMICVIIYNYIYICAGAFQPKTIPNLNAPCAVPPFANGGPWSPQTTCRDSPSSATVIGGGRLLAFPRSNLDTATGGFWIHDAHCCTSILVKIARRGAWIKW